MELWGEHGIMRRAWNYEASMSKLHVYQSRRKTNWLRIKHCWGWVRPECDVLRISVHFEHSSSAIWLLQQLTNRFLLSSFSSTVTPSILAGNYLITRLLLFKGTWNTTNVQLRQFKCTCTLTVETIHYYPAHTNRLLLRINLIQSELCVSIRVPPAQGVYTITFRAHLSM